MYSLVPARTPEQATNAGTWSPSLLKRSRPQARVCCPRCGTLTDLGEATVRRHGAILPMFLIHRSGVVTPVFTCPGRHHGAPCGFTDGLRLTEWSNDLKDLLA